MLTSKQLRSLHASGIEVGAHTVTHPILTRTGAADARREIAASKERLTDLLRAPVTLFAYPNGKPGYDYAAEHVRWVREAGYRAAWSTAAGAADRSADIFQLPRFTPWQRTPGKFGFALARGYRRAQTERV